MTERSRRDALERLQVEAKGLETELAAEHAPAFLQRRTELTATLTTERQALSEQERALASARTEAAEAQGRVSLLEAKLQGIEQRRLDVLPLLLFGAIVVVVISTRPWSWPLEPLGFGLGGFLGLLFGPRMLQRVRGETPPVVDVAPTDRPLVGRPLAALALLALAVPMSLSSAADLFDAVRGDAGGLTAYAPGFGARAFGQLFAVLGALVALRGAGEEPRRAMLIAKRLVGVLGLSMAGVITLRWTAGLFLDSGPNVDTEALWPALAPLLPLAAAVRSRWAAMKSNLLRLVASPVAAALSSALALMFRGEYRTGDALTVVLGASAQLTALGFMLASDLDERTSPGVRWGLRLLSFAPLGLYFL